MEPRKLIKLGNSSYAIALPKEWVDKSGLKKGDSIHILPNSHGELIIMPQYQKANNERKKRIDLANKNYKEVEREIVASYIQGNSLIEASTASEKEMSYFKEAIKRLPSVELIEQDGSKMIARDLMDIRSISIENIMRRIDNILRSLFEDLGFCIKKGLATPKQLEEAVQTDKEINKFYFLLWKMLTNGLENPSIVSALDTTYKDLFIHWLIGLNIENTGDELKRIFRALTKKRLEKAEIAKISTAYAFILDNYINALNAYYKHDEGASLDVARSKEKMIALCDFSQHTKNVRLEEIGHRMRIVASNVHNITKSALYFMK